VALRAFGVDPVADFNRAGEGDGLDGLGVDEGAADGAAAAGDEVDDAGGDAGFMTGFNEAPGAEGGDAGGLDDDRVAADEGGSGTIPGGPAGFEAPPGRLPLLSLRPEQSLEAVPLCC